MKENIHFSFPSSLFSHKKTLDINIEEESISIQSPKIKYFVLHEGENGFEIKKENISTMGFTYYSVVPLIIGLFLLWIGYLQFDSIFYQEQYAIYSMFAIILGFFSGNYFYKNIIKLNKKLEEIKLSKELIVQGIFLILAIILLFITLINVGFIAIFIGAIMGIGALLILSSLSIKYEILDKKGRSNTFLVLIWYGSEVKRIFNTNFPEFTSQGNLERENTSNYSINKGSISDNQEISNKSINNHKNEENIRYNGKINKKKGGISWILINFGLILGAILCLLIAYIIPLDSRAPDSNIFYVMTNVKKTFGEIGIGYNIMYAFLTPVFLLLFLLFISISSNRGIHKIFGNIFSIITLFILMYLAFNPIKYMTIYIFNEREVIDRALSMASSQVAFGGFGFFCIFSAIFLLGYCFHINKNLQR